MIGFIDPPGRYVPKTQWRRFLAHMQTLPRAIRRCRRLSGWRTRHWRGRTHWRICRPLRAAKLAEFLDFLALKRNFKGRDDAVLSKARHRL